MIWLTWITNNRWVWGNAKCILNSADVSPPNPSKLWLHNPNNTNIINDTSVNTTSNSVVSSPPLDLLSKQFSVVDLSGRNNTNSLNSNNNGLVFTKKDYKDCFIEAAKSERRWKRGEAVYGSFKSGHPSLSCISLDHRCIRSPSNRNNSHRDV